jgi:hypothetical protein
MSIAQQTVGTGATAIYTSSGSSAITTVYLMNNDAGPVTVQIHIVKNGESATVSNKIKKDLAIAAADTYILDTERLILDNGDSMQVSASVDAVIQATVSYIGV